MLNFNNSPFNQTIMIFVFQLKRTNFQFVQLISPYEVEYYGIILDKLQIDIHCALSKVYLALDNHYQIIEL